MAATVSRGADFGWDPGQYEQFSDHRLRPALDLLARIPGDFRDIWDLGCGTGEITRIMADRWPSATVRGLDTSAEMLAEAPRHDRISWIQGDIATWSPAHPPDLVFSNATLHWLDDHAALLPRLVRTVRTGGVLAVQMPRNFVEPSHTLLAELARSPRFRDTIGHLVTPPPVATPEEYHALLAPHAPMVDIWETIYLQRLTGADPVAEWTRGTAARPFLAALEPGEQAAFMALYSERLAEAYPTDADGVTLFPFRRLFIVAAG